MNKVKNFRIPRTVEVLGSIPRSVTNRGRLAQLAERDLHSRVFIFFAACQHVALASFFLCSRPRAGPAAAAAPTYVVDLE